MSASTARIQEMHITLGHNMDDQPEMAIMISVGTIRWNFKPEELWEDPTMEQQHYPWWWIPKVSDPKPTTTSEWKGQTSKGNTYHATDKKPPVTSIITFPGTSTASTGKGSEDRPLAKSRDKGEMFENYMSIDEFLYMHGDEMKADEVKDYEDLNQVLDEVTKAFDALGLDFDYELAPQVGQVLSQIAQTSIQKRMEEQYDMTDPAIQGWFD